ncbi:alpha/beta fold hydrolase [Brevibacterium sp. BRM-1]|uniref:alpha/beta fold hydrolase n=1 Tax=Brevibacterium sp. BRM-1 TaxID=2999062 RepID=UPI002281DF56|nr:alpha/beta fold hydrolase [Brevibacterium sp. BRM-1]WAL40460.1 alpha/beta fold hydrolase [Brevibacterium sp. BRM-1]
MPAYTLVNEPAPEAPLLVLGPPLGTSAEVWAGVAYRFADDYTVALLDLPGHGLDAARADRVPDSLTVEDIAAGAVAVADELGRERFHYAGCSISGGAGLVLGAEHAHRLASLSVLCAGPRFGTPEAWEARIADVAADGTGSLIPDTADRWFAAGFLDEDIAAGPMVLEMLRRTDDRAYIACCRALARFDADARVESIAAPALFLAGAQDLGNTPEDMEALAARVEGASFAVIPDAAHLVMVEHPELVAERLERHLAAHD